MHTHSWLHLISDLSLLQLWLQLLVFLERVIFYSKDVFAMDIIIFLVQVLLHEV